MFQRGCFLPVLFCLILQVCGDDSHGSVAETYTKEDFSEKIAEKKLFVMFFAPWCGHCKRLAPTWDELAKVYNVDGSDVTIAKVDCTSDTSLCADQHVQGYPTLKFFHNDPIDFTRYKGNRDLDSLKEFVQEEASRVKEEKEEIELPGSALYELTADDFEKHIETGDHFVKFYAPWCGHCQRLAPTWQELANGIRSDDKVTIAKIDCTAHKRICDQYQIRGYPTLLWFSGGQKTDQYKGSRSYEDLNTYVKTQMEKKAESEGKQEEDVEKIPEERVGEEKVEEEKPEKDAEEEDYASEEDWEEEVPVFDLDDESFEEVIQEGVVFVKFYAPWCGHCKRLAPTWEELGARYAGSDTAIIARVDCTKYRELCGKHQVRGYPTLVLFRSGVRVEEYSGQRDIHSLSQFVDRYVEAFEEEEDRAPPVEGEDEEGQPGKKDEL